MLSRNKRAPPTEDGRVELENKISFDAIFLELKKGKQWHAQRCMVSGKLSLSTMVEIIVE